MKRLYQTKVKTELQVPQDLEKDEFLKLIGGEKNLRSETNILSVSEDENTAILDALCKYTESSIGVVDDYSGILRRGETRNRYYLNVSLENDGKQIYTRVIIDFIPQDLGI